MGTTWQFNRTCDIIRDTLSALSREANNAAWLAGHLKVTEGRDGDETFDALCNAQAKITALYGRMNGMFEGFAYPPNSPDEGKEQGE